MNFLEKLDFMMEKHSLNKNTLSKACNIPYTTIDNWYKRGYEGLKLATVRKLADFFDTTLDYWFLDEIIDETYGKSSGFEVSYDEMKHIEKYRSLDSFGQETVSYILNRELERTVQLKERQDKNSIASKMEEEQVIYLPELYSRFSAGTGQYSTDSGYEMTQVPRNALTSQATSIATISGDSMEPEYQNGDRVLIKTMPDIELGEIGVWSINNELYIKAKGDRELISLNPDYDNIEIKENDSAYCIGKVLGKLD